MSHDPLVFFLTVCLGVVLGRLIGMAFYKNCSLSGHDFKPYRKTDICSKCNLIRRKVEK